MLISLSMDFRGADIRTRERFHLSEERVAALYAEPRDALVREFALVSTCNRIELYGATAPGAQAAEVVHALSALAHRWMGDGMQADELIEVATHRSGMVAAEHLIRVAAGLESMILGDNQILGQVRTAYRRAAEAGAMGPVLHRLFDTAMRVGKRVQHETSLVGGRASVGAEAAQLTARRLGQLARRRCVVIGCGKTGVRAARQLVKLGAVDVVLINRTPQRAQQLATDLWGRAAPFAALHRELAVADVGVVATSADLPPVRAASLKFCREMAGTSDRELLLIDLSMPRNVDPDVVGLSGVSLVDLDTLAPPVQAAEALRKAAVPEAEGIVREEAADFGAWLDEATVREAIGPLRDLLAEVCRREVGFAAGADVADRTADRIVAKLLAQPMTALRVASRRGESLEQYTEALHRLFAREGAPTGEHPLVLPVSDVEGAVVRAKAS